MFEAVGLTLDRDHLDLSFADSDGWTRVGPMAGMPPSQWIKLGDPERGPAVQLGMVPPVPDTIWLDTHYHASDQLRVAIRGDFQLQRKHMTAGVLGYQVAGIPYREGLVGGGSDPLWMFSIQGTWRGARSTNTRDDGTFLLGDIAPDQLDRPVGADEADYWDSVPGGAKGTAALATTGAIRGGFSWEDFAEAGAWGALAPGVRVAAGVLGDPDCGPAVLAIAADPGAIAVPACRAGTELVIAVVRGSCAVGTRVYGPGELRVQDAGARLPAVEAGAEGADFVLMISDRRHLPIAIEAGAAAAWVAQAAAIIDGLVADCTVPVAARRVVQRSNAG